MGVQKCALCCSLEFFLSEHLLFSFQKILIHGEIMEGIILQILSLEIISSDKITLQLSDTINKTQKFDITVSGSITLAACHIIKIQEYSLEFINASINCSAEW